MLNIFYAEPDPDRWVPFDRYPRQLIRRVVRGPRQPGGMERYFLNLRAGLDRLRIPYRVNDYARARRNPREPVGIVGKGHVLDEMEWRNPIVYGPAVASHPLEDPKLLERRPVERVLVSCNWLRDMYTTHYPADRVAVWAAGIDTYAWAPTASSDSREVIVYDKIRWERDRYEPELVEVIRNELTARGVPITYFRYGSYREADYRAALSRAAGMIFLCEHETQGFAYLQALACDVPIFAWDRGGPWKDPQYYPERAQFAPVTSVPYWDERCGTRFTDAAEFRSGLEEFLAGAYGERFSPREYVSEHLSLEACAKEYAERLATVSS